MNENLSFKRVDSETSAAGKYEYLVPQLEGMSKNISPDISAASVAAKSLQRVFKEGYAREEFRRNLLRLLELEPIEDGYIHPAERILEDAWKKYRLVFPDWIQSVYIQSFNRSTISAGILRCVGRLPRELVHPWGLVMAIGGLSHFDIEVREAAVRALELWGGRESLYVLKTRVEVETVPWLVDYIKQVIEDISE
ncbi:hypothetical protein [Argonema galeatum]|uniref:hypothetical protein n=1 Tax=Argonema galeatum TaxID=2942762 RepID=UPI0020121124|nr:hypothetical protein [Argonema galeatum]MCL1468472.1 hypothetical protein [Argonema galeatum A003/A1]